MKVTARGWSRNMGTNVIFDHDLVDVHASRDSRQYLSWGTPTIFKSLGNVGVHWGRDLSFTGSYRVEVNFSRPDVVRLFKAMFGSELDVDLVEECGFTISSDLQKAILGKIKLADLTIGDLAGLGAPAKEVKPDTDIKPRLRRV